MEKDSEILATAPQPVQGRRRLAWRGWALAALLGTSVLVAGFWMLRRHDGRQTAMAQQFANQASAFMMQKKWAEAKPLLIKAFKADSADPLVLRTCAFYEREAVNNLECAGYYLTQLERTGKATDTDHAMFGQSLAVTGLVAEARSIFNNLPMAARGSKEAIELEALLAMHDGDSARATSLMRRALAQDPDSESSQLKLALLDLNCIFPEIQCQAATSLMKIARDGGSLSTSAALHLASHPALQKNEAEELMQIAPHLPEGGDAVRLAALHACICFSPKARESLLDRETQNADALSPEQLAGLCRWLNNEGEHQRVLQLLNRERAEKFPVLFSPFIDALLRDQKWGEITAMLDNAKNLPLNTLNMVQLRARCAYGTGAPFNVVHDLLEQARRLATASKESFALEQLGDIALSMGQDEVALACLSAMTASTPLQQEKLNARILSIQLQHGDLHDALNTLAKTSGSSQPSPADAERLIYFKLIVGVEQETVMEQCEQMFERGLIKASSLQFFRALHAYRQGDRVTMREALANVQPDTLPTNWRGVCAGLLAIAGEKARAFQLAEKITPNALFPDEQRILANAL